MQRSLPGCSAVAYANTRSDTAQYGLDWSTADSALATKLPAATKRIAVRGLLISWLILLIVGCSHPPDEDALRQTIVDMQKAAEGRSLSGVIDHVSDDFGSGQGLDRDTLRRMLQGQILSNAKIGATLGPLTIVLQDARATVDFSMVLTGGSGRFIPEQGRAYKVSSGWRIEDGEWKVYFADWNGDAR